MNTFFSVICCVLQECEKLKTKITEQEHEIDRLKQKKQPSQGCHGNGISTVIPNRGYVDPRWSAGLGIPIHLTALTLQHKLETVAIT